MLIEPATTMTILMRKVEEGMVVLRPLVSRFAFVSLSNVGSQFPTLGH